MHCFYAPQLVGMGPDALSDDEWRHIKALRIKSGETICLIDGKGNAQHCVFHLQDKKPVLEVSTSISFHERESGVHLYIPMTQQTDRIEWMLEKCVEMGLHSLNLMTTQHSEKVKYSMERLIRIAVSAMKQSQRKWLPSIDMIDSWNEVLHRLKGRPVFIAHCEQSEKMPWTSIQVDHPHVLIGPEGDFSRKEIGDVEDLGGIPIALGNARLRTETAGLLVVSKYYSL
jgi:16S rRNA (uracil1498-N3)-methyltransferase